MTSQRPRTHVVCSKELKEAVQMCALTCDNFWAEYLTKAEKVGNVIRRLRLDIETLYSQEGRTSSISNYINETEHVLVFLLCRVVFFHESLQSFDSFPVSDFTGAYEAFLNELLVPESLDEVFQIVTLLRKYDTSNTLGTIFLSSVFGSSAYYLSLLPSYTRTLGDSLQKLAQRVHDQAELGRVGRSPGLILSLVEDCYRTVTHIKHFLTACPFLATYMDVGSISRGFSLLVDSIIPCVMHFVITCEEMVSHRLRLQMLLNESYNDALLISAVLLSVGDESCRTDSFRSVSICITSLIVEHTNNSCAMGLRRSGWDYAEWLQVLYSNRTTALSVTEASASHNAYMILINIASESAHVSSMYISWICECLDYSLEATNHTNKDTVAYQSASETSDSVTQLQDMFPSWPDGLAELAVDYYGQDIGGLIEDALIGNLPQNLSYYIEVGHVPAEMKQQSNRLMPLNKKTTAVRKDDTPAPSRLYRPETQSLNTSSIEATVSNPSSYFKTLRNTSFLFNTETQLEIKINTLRLLENKVEYDDEPDDSQYIEEHIRSQYPGVIKQKDINNT